MATPSLLPLVCVKDSNFQEKGNYEEVNRRVLASSYQRIRLITSRMPEKPVGIQGFDVVIAMAQKNGLLLLTLDPKSSRYES